MSDKKYTAREAAIAVLKKAEELYSLSKARVDEGSSIKQKRSDRFDRRTMPGHEAGMAGVHEPISHKEKPAHGDMGQSVAGLYPRASKEGIKLDAGDKAIQSGEHKRVMESMPKPKLDKSEAPMKGHIKLAKFVGRMEAKRGKPLDKGETGHEKGVHSQVSSHSDYKGQSMPGTMARMSAGPNGNKEAANAGAKMSHERVLSEIKKIKPKLPG